MIHYTKERIIEGLHNKEDDIINYVYKTSFPVIERLVINNNGTDEDVKDIFQEALIITYNKILNTGLTLTCSFNSYLYSICRRLWLKVLEKRRTQIETITNCDEFIDENEFDEKLERKKLEIYEFHFNKLSKDCQKILNFHFSRIPIAEIMKKMEYNSEQHTMDRKYRCKKSLFKRIENDPKFKEIKNELY